MQRKLTVLFTVLILFASGCASLSSSRLTEEEWETVIQSARAKVFASNLFTEEEKKITLAVNPTIHHYIISKPYAQYRVFWELNEKEEIFIKGEGDILKLEGSTIQRRLKTE